MSERKIPIIKPLPADWTPVRDPNPTVAICGECGLHIKQVMGYVCNIPRCPTGLGGTQCSAALVTTANTLGWSERDKGSNSLSTNGLGSVQP